jgi:hypothetical protein
MEFRIQTQVRKATKLDASPAKLEEWSDFGGRSRDNEQISK